MISQLAVLCLWLCHVAWWGPASAKTIDWKLSDPDNEFHFGEESAKYVLYRLIGNDMPPLQSVSPRAFPVNYSSCCSNFTLLDVFAWVV
jgi:hypothetical protein